MAKTIITQEGHLVNYANVVAVSVDVMSKDDEEYSEDEAYVLVAHDTTNSVIALGYYPTEEQACEAEKKLADWLDHEAYGVYRFDSKGAM